MSEPGVTEVFFYHLERATLEEVLPTLLERSLERGWRAAVQAASEERVEALDTLLWTYREDSFLAHGTARDGPAAAQPIYLTADAGNPNEAQIRFLVDGADLEDATPLHPRGVRVRRTRRRRRCPRARAMARGQGARLERQLLAAGFRRPLAAEGLTRRAL